MFELRDYQEVLLDKTRRALRVHRRVLMQLPTGGGKTVCAGTMLAGAASQGKRAWFVVHRRELVEQTAKTLERVGLRHGFCAAGFPPRYKEPVTLCSVQTLRSRADRLPPPDLICWDEAHHCAAGAWRRISDQFPNAFHVGLTATPERLDGKGLDGLFNAIVPGPTVAWLIDNGHLSRYRVWAAAAPPVDDVKDRGADFDAGALAAHMDKPHLTGDAVEHYLKICPSARAVVFCVNVTHALHTRDAFRAAGVACEELDGSADARTRRETVRDFRAGRIRVLTSVDLFGEGFDLPELEAVILLRPTKSLGLYLQQVGRCLRTAQGKEGAIILDHAGNVARHGLPDEEREWTLQGRRKKRSGKSPHKVCGNCFGSCAVSAPECPYCGAPFVGAPRELDHRDGQLFELDVEALRLVQRSEVKQARTREELEAIARARGYKPGWVRHILSARRAAS